MHTFWAIILAGLILVTLPITLPILFGCVIGIVYICVLVILMIWQIPGELAVVIVTIMAAGGYLIHTRRRQKGQ